MAAPSSAARDKSGDQVTQGHSDRMASMTGFVVFMIAFLSFAIQPPSGTVAARAGLNRPVAKRTADPHAAENAATDLSAFRLTCLGVGF